MKQKNITGILLLLVLVIFTTSLTFAPGEKKFSPAGTWEFKAPEAPEGYTTGNLVISKKKSGYAVTMEFNEYMKYNAVDVVYKAKKIEFTVYVEGETVNISGTFKKDSFTGDASYSGGVLDLTAQRKGKK
ncbi:MAG: hypothetical protein KAX05_03700 [Bacteroidales bacterium]|nr:hypothetical protein [Bacteroidales bacterium]